MVEPIRLGVVARAVRADDGHVADHRTVDDPLRRLDALMDEQAVAEPPPRRGGHRGFGYQRLAGRDRAVTADDHQVAAGAGPPHHRARRGELRPRPERRDDGRLADDRPVVAVDPRSGPDVSQCLRSCVGLAGEMGGGEGQAGAGAGGRQVIGERRLARGPRVQRSDRRGGRTDHPDEQHGGREAQPPAQRAEEQH